MDAREEILSRLKNAIHPEPEPVDFDSPIYHPINEPLDLAFKKNLELVNGCVYLCNSEQELANTIKPFLQTYKSENICCRQQEIIQLLNKFNIGFSECKKTEPTIEVGILSCEFLIAHTGSVMVSSAQSGGRQLLIYPPVQVFIASKNQLVDYLENAYTNVQKKYGKDLPSQIALVTGPSRTADIEKTLILGAHGPKEVHVFIY